MEHYSQNELLNPGEYNKYRPIVFAEDDPVDQEMILRALKKMGYAGEVHFVSDGSEALEYVYATGQYSWKSRQALPRVIILDIRMPKLNGFEVLKRIRNDEGTKYLPVVVFTSSTADYDCIDSYKFGANSFIIKPFNFEDFQQAVVDMVNYWMKDNRPLD